MFSANGSTEVNKQLVESQRQEYLAKLSAKLSSDDPSYRALLKAFQEIYEQVDNIEPELKARYETGLVRIYYQAGSAVERGRWERIDMVEGLTRIPDPFVIFEKLGILDFTTDSSQQAAIKMAEAVSKITGIPILWGTPGTKYNPDIKDIVDANMVPIEEGKFVYNYANEDNYENLGQVMYVEVPNPKPGSPIKYISTQEPAIVLNRSKLDDPALIQTPVHELGHIAERKLGIPHSEVISSLYGLRAAMLVARTNEGLAVGAMKNPIQLYNWTVYGTIAPY